MLLCCAQCLRLLPSCLHRRRKYHNGTELQGTYYQRMCVCIRGTYCVRSCVCAGVDASGAAFSCFRLRLADGGTGGEEGGTGRGGLGLGSLGSLGDAREIWPGARARKQTQGRTATGLAAAGLAALAAAAAAAEGGRARPTRGDT